MPLSGTDMISESTVPEDRTIDSSGDCAKEEAIGKASQTKQEHLSNKPVLRIMALDLFCNALEICHNNIELGRGVRNRFRIVMLPGCREHGQCRKFCRSNFLLTVGRPNAPSLPGHPDCRQVSRVHRTWRLERHIIGTHGSWRPARVRGLVVTADSPVADNPASTEALGHGYQATSAKHTARRLTHPLP